MSWRLTPKEAGLIIIDLQEKLIPILHEKEKVIQKTRALIEVAKIFHLPIFFTEQLPEKLGATIPEIKNALPNFIQPLAKSEFSALHCLPEELPRHLLIAGCETHVCVRQTAYDLREEGKSVYLIADATSSRQPLDHELAIHEMQQDKIIVTSVETISWELVQKAGTDLFRQVLAILK
ncbi:MAG: isochorismatase family protein [Verrucomicrobiae bacterium]|nr:isochorismatase family protein [Verrucomicrobiae bacterium]